VGRRGRAAPKKPAKRRSRELQRKLEAISAQPFIFAPICGAAALDAMLPAPPKIRWHYSVFGPLLGYWDGDGNYHPVPQPWRSLSLLLWWVP
jgi:hypothetical protein